jgi:hypothetical protein
VIHDSVPAPARDGQMRSPFTSILETLCESCVGALGAALVDEEGENVDLATSPVLGDDSRVFQLLQPYQVKLCGAHWQIVFRQAAAQARLGKVRQLWVGAAEHGYVVCNLTAGYVLVVICRRGAMVTVSQRALRQAEVEICYEAGWRIPRPDAPYWRRTRVCFDGQGQPKALQFPSGMQGLSASHVHAPWDTEVASAGPMTAGLGGFEQGFHVVTPSGEELAIVREPSGFWYTALRVPHQRGLADS